MVCPNTWRCERMYVLRLICDDLRDILCRFYVPQTCKYDDVTGPMPAKVTQLSVEGLRTSARKAQKVDVARENAAVRAEIAEESGTSQSNAFVRLANRARSGISSAMGGNTTPSSDTTHVYREYSSGIKLGILGLYDKALTGGDHAHCAKLHQSRDLDIAIRDLTFGSVPVTNPLVGAFLTAGSISLTHKLGGGGGGLPATPAPSLDILVASTSQ